MQAALNSSSHLNIELLRLTKRKEYDPLYYALNQDKIRDSQRKYRLRNKGKRMEYYSLYCNRNKAKKRDYDRQYQCEHRDRINQSNRQYYARNKDYVGELNRANYIRNHDHPGTYLSRDSVKSWKTPELVRCYLESIADRLNIASYADWSRVSYAQIRDLGGRSLYEKFEHLGGVLRYAYPEINWNTKALTSRQKKSEQWWLRAKIEELLPGILLIEEYQHPELTWENLSRNIELDIWIPQHAIGIEYQGEQHYYNLTNAFGPNGTSGLYSGRDLVKHSLCQMRGITLITIPFWWDGALDSLSATLYLARPDIFPVSTARPIPREIPLTPSLPHSRIQSDIE